MPKFYGSLVTFVQRRRWRPNGRRLQHLRAANTGPPGGEADRLARCVERQELFVDELFHAQRAEFAAESGALDAAKW